jgi:hypothetical protein
LSQYEPLWYALVTFSTVFCFFSWYSTNEKCFFFICVQLKKALDEYACIQLT